MLYYNSTRPTAAGRLRERRRARRPGATWRKAHSTVANSHRRYTASDNGGMIRTARATRVSVSKGKQLEAGKPLMSKAYSIRRIVLHVRREAEDGRLPGLPPYLQEPSRLGGIKRGLTLCTCPDPDGALRTSLIHGGAMRGCRGWRCSQARAADRRGCAASPER